MICIVIFLVLKRYRSSCNDVRLLGTDQLTVIKRNVLLTRRNIKKWIF